MGGGLRSALEEAFGDCRPVPDIRLVTGKDVRRNVREACAAGVETVAVGGGDGTLNAAVQELAGTDVRLGVVPMGTMNHFARDAGIPLALPEAVAVVLRGAERRVDIGVANGVYFINFSALGLYPAIIRDRDDMRARLGWGKWTAMTVAAIRLLKRLPLLSVRLEAEGMPRLFTTSALFIGNNRFRLDPVAVLRRSSLTEGVLSVHASRRADRVGALRFLFDAFGSRHAARMHVDAVAALDIDARKSLLRVSMDGEVLRLAPPLRYRICPLALRVIVPAS